MSAHVSYEDRLAVWLLGLHLGLIGKVKSNPVTYDLLTDPALICQELNVACEIGDASGGATGQGDLGFLVTEQMLRTVVDTFGHLQPPYSATRPMKERLSASIKMKKKPQKAKPNSLSAYEVSQLGPHLRGLVGQRPVSTPSVREGSRDAA